MSSNFYQQSEVAAALTRLAARIAAYAATHRAHILELRYAAENTGRDFPTLVVARVLGVDYSEITDLERWAAKEGLCPRVGEMVAALTAQREAARALAEAKRAAAAQAETARWAPHRLQVMNGGLLEVPVWGDHYRCRNWGAIVALNPTLPGGLDRWWFNRGSGPVKLIVPNELDVHDPVEFGADYIRGSGYRDPERWYGVVLENEATHLLIEPCRDVLHALTLAAKRQES